MITSYKIFEKIIYPENYLDTIAYDLDDDFLQKILKFFGYEKSDLKFLGSGFYGNAYLIIPENKVLKITSDKNEYYNALKLKNINTKYIVNYYDAREITNVEMHNFFALILDYVEPINEKQKEIFKILNNLDTRIFDHLTNKNWSENFLNNVMDLTSDEDLIKRYEFSQIYNMANDIVNIINEGKKFKIKIADINKGNLGYIYDEKEKRYIYVLFDVGVSYNHLDRKKLDRKKLKEIE